MLYIRHDVSGGFANATCHGGAVGNESLPSGVGRLVRIPTSFESLDGALQALGLIDYNRQENIITFRPAPLVVYELVLPTLEVATYYLPPYLFRRDVYGEQMVSDS